MNLNIFELDTLLMHVETIFSGWNMDADWTDWDEKIRLEVAEFRTKYTYRTQGQKWEEMVKAGEVSEDTVPLRHYAQLCEILDKRNQQMLSLKSINGQWTKTADRLPDAKQVVLCYTRYRTMISRDWEEFTNQNAEWFKENFTHWMPLPQMPDEGGQEKPSQKMFKSF